MNNQHHPWRVIGFVPIAFELVMLAGPAFCISQGKADEFRPVAHLDTKQQKPQSDRYKGIESLAFSPNGEFLVSSDLFEISLWNIDTHESRQFRAWPPPGARTTTSAVAFTPNGKKLIAARDQLCQILDFPSGKPIGRSFEGTWSFCCIAISRDGKLVAAGCQKTGAFNIGSPVPSQTETLRVRNLENGERLALEPVAPLDDVFSVAFSSDSKSLVAAGHCYGDTLGFIRLFDVETGKRRYGIFSSDTVRSAAISCDGKTLAGAGLGEPLLGLWDAATKNEIRKLSWHQWAVLAIAFSPDGKLLASAANDGTVCLWEVSTGKRLASLKGHKRAVQALAVSPNGALLATGSSDGIILLWDLKSFAR